MIPIIKDPLTLSSIALAFGILAYALRTFSMKKTWLKVIANFAFCLCLIFSALYAMILISPGTYH